MASLSRFCAVCAVLGLVALASPASAVDSVDIYGDYVDNGRIDEDYGAGDLITALARAHGDVSYDGFAAAVQGALEHQLLGTSEPGSGEAGGVRVIDDGGSELPVPRHPDEGDGAPWPFDVVVVLAGALIVSGAGGSVYRRARR